MYYLLFFRRAQNLECRMRAASIDALHLSFLASPCGGSSICFFVPGTNGNGTGGDVTAITTYKIAAVILSCILFYSYNKLSFIYSLNYLRDACMILRSKFSTCY